MAVMPTMMGVAIALEPGNEPSLRAIHNEIERMLTEPRYRSWRTAHGGDRWALADTARTRLIIRAQERDDHR